MCKEDKINRNKYRSKRKSRNKIVENWTISKSRNLLRFRSRNLFHFKKLQSVNVIEKLKFLNKDNRFDFINFK